MKLMIKIMLALSLLLTGFAAGGFLTYLSFYSSVNADLNNKLHFHQILSSDDAETRLQEVKALYQVQLPYLTCLSYTFYHSGISQLGFASEADVKSLHQGFATLGVDPRDDGQKEAYCQDKSPPWF